MTKAEIRTLGREAVARELGPEIWASQHGALLDRGCILLDGACDCLPVGERMTFAAAADRCKRYGI